MRVPTIHLNGTSQESLLSEAKHAFDSVQSAIQAVSQITVHGRDFYPQGGEAIEAAMLAHADVLLRLRDTNAELLAYALSIQDGGHKGDVA